MSSRRYIQGLAGITRTDVAVMTTSLADPQAFQSSLDRDQQALQRAGFRPLPPVADPPPLYLVAPEGQLQVHTAPYRGSFASVLSQAMRAAAAFQQCLCS